MKRKKFGKGKGKKALLEEHTETNGVSPGGIKSLIVIVFSVIVVFIVKLRIIEHHLLLLWSLVYWPRHTPPQHSFMINPSTYF